MKQNNEELLIQCSKIHLIMQNESNMRFTENMDADIAKLKTKVKPLTQKQQERLQYLEDKKQQSFDIKISNSCKEYLLEIYAKQLYGKRYSFIKGDGVSQMINGIKQEKPAIDLLSKLDNSMYFRYKKSIKNEYLSGQIDIIDAPTIESATKVIEIKNVQSITELLKRVNKPIDQYHYLQLQGYLAITGMQNAELRYCLLPPPENIIEEQKVLYFQKYGEYTNDQLFLKWNQILKNIKYDDIDLTNRVISYKVERDDKLINEIYKRVNECRKWLSEFAIQHKNTINEKSYT